MWNACTMSASGELGDERSARLVAARAFDVARYLLFWGVPTNVGQVCSIRTLEKQIRRLEASEYEELRSLGDEIAQACAAPPDCVWDAAAKLEPLAPTLARHADADQHADADAEQEHALFLPHLDGLGDAFFDSHGWDDDHELGEAVALVELEDGAQVVFYSFFGQPHPGGNLLVRLALGDELQDLPFA